MPTIGQSISRTDLLARAKDFQTATAANQAIPYQRALKAENDSFISSLQNAPEGSLADLKANATQTAAAAQKKALLCTIGGLGLIVGSMMIPGASSLVHIGGFVAGFYVSNSMGGRAAAEAASNKVFASQLGEWQRSIDASAQAPAPAQPAPAQPPAEQPAQAQA